MHSRAQLALVRPGTEVTALRELFSELVTDPVVVSRLTDLVSGAENRYVGSPDAPAHPLAGTGCPTSPWRMATDLVASRSSPVLGGRCLSISPRAKRWPAAVTEIADQLTVAAGRPVGDVAAGAALLVRPDGYVAWATSGAPDIDELRRRVLARWFGI